MRNNYSTGNNIYRGGSPHATSGQVDPSGYVDRELRQRRSKLAEKMLQNHSSMGNSNMQNAQNPSNLNKQGAVHFPVQPRHMSLLAIRALRGGLY